MKRAKWDPARHPRNPIGRFIEVGGSSTREWNPKPGIRNSQIGVRDLPPGSQLGNAAYAVEGAYSRGTMFDSPNIRSLPAPQKQAVEEYVYASTVNDALRHQPRSEWSAHDTEIVSQLDDLMTKSTLTQDLTVYRGVASGRVGGPLRGANPGDQIVDRGYSSTSMNPAAARDYGDDLMEIELPAGTHAAPLSKVDPAEYGPNAEVTVDRGAVYEIISIEETPDRDSMFGETPRLIRARLIGYMED